MKMKAIVLTGHGGPENLKFLEVDRPEIKAPNDVLVRVVAAGLNPADVQARRRPFESYVKEQKSAGLILGLDGTGIVEAVGSAVTKVRKGDEVYYVDGGYGVLPGSHAEYKVVNENYLAPKPTSLDFATAAATPVVSITVWECLYDRIGIKQGDFVLVHGGAGGLGHLGIQFARLRGARVAATVSTDAKAALARDLGAEHIIRYRDENVVDAVRNWTGKAGADVILDTVGHENFAACFDQVGHYGAIISTVVSDWPKANTLMPEFFNIRVGFENMGLPQVAQDHQQRLRQTKILNDVGALFDAGDLRVVVGARFPLAEAAEAHRALEAGEVTGRVVLEMS